MTRYLCAALLALLPAGCKREKEPPPRAETPAQAERTVQEPIRKAVFPEDEAAGVLRAISDSEIGMAQVALRVSRSDAVLGFAGVLVADHRAIVQLLDSLLAQAGETARENPVSAQWRSYGDSVARALGTMSSGFNNTFIEEQVAAQSRILQVLDTALIPSARSAQVHDFLSALRPTFAAHMQRAMQILAQRRRDAAERGEVWQSGLPTAADTLVAAPAPQAPRPLQDTTRKDTTPPRTTTSNR